MRIMMVIMRMIMLLLMMMMMVMIMRRRMILKGQEGIGTFYLSTQNKPGEMPTFNRNIFSKSEEQTWGELQDCDWT